MGISTCDVSIGGVLLNHLRAAVVMTKSFCCLYNIPLFISEF